MPRFFPLVLMLLLVLRGLVGTAMAAGMVATLPANGPAQQAHSVPQPLHLSHAAEMAATAEAPGALAMAEHSMHGHSGVDSDVKADADTDVNGDSDSDGDGDGDGDGSHAECSSPSASPCEGVAHAHGPLCSACEICHSALFLPPRPGTPAHIGATEVRPAVTALFASAAAALAIKPPIA